MLVGGDHVVREDGRLRRHERGDEQLREARVVLAVGDGRHLHARVVDGKSHVLGLEALEPHVWLRVGDHDDFGLRFVSVGLGCVCRATFTLLASNFANRTIA